MIPLHDAGWQTKSWQWQMSNAIQDAETLLDYLNLDLSFAPSEFPVFVPYPYLSRIEPGNKDDPLLKQVFPDLAEMNHRPEFTEDPLVESDFSPVKGMLKKYAGRALIISTGRCGIHCRYCFRQHFPYNDFQPDTRDWKRILDLLGKDPSIRELILSGGDPLTLSDSRLKSLVDEFSQVKHLKTLRIHSRMPVVIPQRVCAEMLDWISKATIRIVLVVHINHPDEIDQQVTQSINALTEAGVYLLNQSVLLKGVNDNSAVLADLSWRLFDTGIQPYYLHLMDKVKNAAHFDVSLNTAEKLVETIQNQLPGYLVPKLVTEIAGRLSKTIIR